MQQLNAYRFYELGAKLHGLFSSDAQARVADMFGPLTEAQTLLDGFIKGDGFAPDSSKTEAGKLLAKISAVFNRYFIDPSTKQLKQGGGEDRIEAHELSMLRSLIEKFEQSLAAELNRAPIYMGGKRGIYSSYDLAENAQLIFAEGLRSVIPAAAQNEFKSAGRALVFAMGTAAVTHMLRAVEIMLKLYYDTYAGGPAAKGERNYAMYVKKLAALSEDDEKDKSARPDARVVQMLAQIKTHYRNPLLTPEAVTSVDEAMQLFGMSSALISLMAEQVEARRGNGYKGGEKGKQVELAIAAPDGDEEDDQDIRQAS